MKKCPYCAEEIQDEAIVCRFCNRELNVSQIDKASPPAEAELGPRGRAWKLIGTLLVIIFLLWGVYSFDQAIRESKKVPYQTWSGTLVCEECGKIALWQGTGYNRVKAIGYVLSGTTVLVLNERIDDEITYYYVQYGSQEGWVRDIFFKEP